MINVQGLTKQYGSVEAVTDVSFEVGRDQVVGFLGPNGAGKTTIMKIIAGYHFPTRGTVTIDGLSVQEDPLALKARLGYLPESVPLYGDLTVEEYLSFVAGARLIPAKERKPAIREALKACGLEQAAGKRIETLSKGYKQRAGLAQAIIHDPDILILDEPTSGLDPNQIIEIRALIKELGKRKTLILSTHILQEVEAVCSQVLIINEGRIAAQGRPEAIAETLKGTDTWELTLKDPGREEGETQGGREKIAQKMARLAEGLADGEAPAREADGTFHVSFSVPSGSLGGERIFDWAVAEGLKILSMTQKKLSLEAIFVKLTGEHEGRPAQGAAAAEGDGDARL
ncbi:MAG: ATP-binding cassette domain-containing protein [Spirochaetaceae bacterium]|jgi:ABC-2 type transport system ATP-binding protein|nr:ATP-binding cassette domain-containing protein [Spirochaetaceae bacterium]